jgi:hypothetical protein
LLEIGASVVARTILSTGDQFYIFGEMDVALALCRLPKKVRVLVRAVTAFGVYKQVHWTDDGPVVTSELETGLIIREVIQTEAEKGTA